MNFTDTTKIKAIRMGSVYTHDFQKAMDFYQGILGLEGKPAENSCYFPIGENQGFIWKVVIILLRPTINQSARQ